jgi:hypothetical protein
MSALTRRPNGTMRKGFSGNPGGRPAISIASLRERFSPRLPEIFGALVEMATDKSLPPMAQLAAIRLVLDHLIGRPQISIDAVHTSVNIPELYHSALRRAYGMDQTINSINASGGAISDPTEIQ